MLVDNLDAVFLVFLLYSHLKLGNYAMIHFFTLEFAG